MVVNKPKKKTESSRYTVLYIIMFIIMGTIIAKLLYLQVYKHDEYKEKADVSSTKFISEEAPRGNIYDSNGNVIATNKQTYALTYMETLESKKAFYKTMDKIFQILEENGEESQDENLSAPEAVKISATNFAVIGSLDFAFLSCLAYP